MNELQPFDYGIVDAPTAEKLKRHETAIRSIQSKAVYEIGEELQAAHDELANFRNGTFQKWCNSIGFHERTAERILNYHSFITTNCRDKDLLESLPKSLVYEAARPSTPQELKDAVVSGDVKNLPDFKKLKAELEATKNVLRTTETKLASETARADKSEGDLKAEQESNMKLQTNFRIEVCKEAKNQTADMKEKIESLERDRDAANSLLESTLNGKRLAEQERDDAKAEATSLREKAQAFDDLQKMNHNLRETVRRQADELAERPQVETVVTQEVKPADYDNLKAANENMKRRIAELEAHMQGMSLQELAERDEKRKEYKKTKDEEDKAAEELDDLFTALDSLPTEEAEVRELARCYLDWSLDSREETLEEVQATVRRARRNLDILAEQFAMGPKLKVVK